MPCLAEMKIKLEAEGRHSQNEKNERGGQAEGKTHTRQQPRVTNKCGWSFAYPPLGPVQGCISAPPRALLYQPTPGPATSIKPQRARSPCHEPVCNPCCLIASIIGEVMHVRRRGCFSLAPKVVEL